MPSPSLAHTYGPGCCLQPVPELEPLSSCEWTPPIKAQFFYSSPIPIDDPLSAATAGVADGKGSLRPFSVRDNIALEKAWLGLATGRDRKNHAQSQRNRSPSSFLSRENAEKLEVITQELALKHAKKHSTEGTIPTPVARSDAPIGTQAVAAQVCCPELLIDASVELRREFCSVTRRRQQALNHDRVVQGVVELLSVGHIRPAENTTPVAESQRRSASPSSWRQKRSGDNPYMTSQPVKIKGRGDVAGSAEKRSLSSPEGVSVSSRAGSLGKSIPVRPPIADDGISGRPFVRVEAADTHRQSAPEPLPGGLVGQSKSPTSDRGRPRRGSDAILSPLVGHQDGQPRDLIEIPVGISKLHMVSLPVLQMKPIYWSPVNDVSIVLRATWFYEDSMTPVEASVANQLEAGYRELRPWTETWSDEIRSALQVGSEGEEKLSHRLWPEDTGGATKMQKAIPWEPPISSDPFCASRCFRGEAAAEGTLEPVHLAEDSFTPPLDGRSFSNYHVMYKDEFKAFLLKPSLKPSAYYNRKPMAKIMKGVTVGTPVVRGFERAAWDRLHTKKSASHQPGVGPSPLPEPSQLGGLRSEDPLQCIGCQHDKRQEQITDLVLVAHGIGQKYSRRVESYSFTLAINAFRRAVNVELQNDSVKSAMREGQNGIMVLPVNWRLAVSLDVEDDAEREAQSVKEDFTLKDIEPNSIKAVRGIISEVMFDIPFYMSSKHKPKMVAALVAEANRIIRLWSRNHAGEHPPRIHFIGHSLGSAMLLDVLSNQPTTVPPLDLSQQMNTAHFEFNTTNLFFLGSPAGFFLLLERGNLCPRRGRQKPGADPHDTLSNDIVGVAGQFGCLAVDNIYNILAREDPIAYNLNGTIDPAYAAGLKEAYLPATTTSFFNAVRNIAGIPIASDIPTPSKPPTVRLPSQLELEVHDFTREEIAEKKAYLLNDNGQVDYFLRSGGGPLEIQYLNMLSAHTSYWTNQDLIRMLCLEIGRKPGKDNALQSMRVVKAKKRPLVGQQ